MGELLSVGSINLDVQVRAPRWPHSGETLLGDRFRLLGGGKAANAALIARRMGVDSRLFGRVGDDDFRELAVHALHEAGVDLSGVRSVAGQQTGTALIVVAPTGEKTIVLALNANDVWTTEDAAALSESIGAAPEGSVLVTDLEVPGFVVRCALSAARQRGLPSVLDPSPAERLTDDLWPLIDAVTPNAVEAEQLTGIAVRDASDAARAGGVLVSRGVRRAYVKLAGGGCVVVTESEHCRVQAPRVQVVDGTGAGDAFAGALGVALIEGRSLYESARMAVAASSAAVMRYGSQPSYPMRDELERVLADVTGGRASP